MLRSILALSTRERLLIAEAAVLLVGVGAAVRVVAYTRVRALVAEAMLERRGHETALRFGVDDADTDVEAHAWLESGGEIVVGDENREAYTRLEAPSGGDESRQGKIY